MLRNPSTDRALSMFEDAMENIHSRVCAIQDDTEELACLIETMANESEQERADELIDRILINLDEM